MTRRRILTVGDSFTFGEELPDREQHAFPYLLRDYLGVNEVINLGLGGASSDYVFRTTIETLISDPDPFDLVLVCWPEQSRFEAIHNHPSFVPTESAPHIKPKVCLIRKPGKATPGYEPKWVQEYYKYSYDTAWGYRKQFNQMIALQAFLKQRKQPYAMYNVAGLQGEYDRYKVFLQHQFAEIDSNNFIGWPLDGLLEWQGDCVKAPGGHPLELGHQRIAKVIYEHIRNSGWFS